MFDDIWLRCVPYFYRLLCSRGTESNPKGITTGNHIASNQGYDAPHRLPRTDKNLSNAREKNFIGCGWLRGKSWGILTIN